ncbi:hypothetical protein [Micromonospora sp. CA-246542]|uniref:hypothetical protein n=1 Tax=Micromonospora sp. CA-246542 TaxID=3239959 RepID=UPI003D9087EF
MRGRLGTLTALYVTQYLGIGFITVGLTAILRDGGTAVDATGRRSTGVQAAV